MSAWRAERCRKSVVQVHVSGKKKVFARGKKGPVVGGRGKSPEDLGPSSSMTPQGEGLYGRCWGMGVTVSFGGFLNFSFFVINVRGKFWKGASVTTVARRAGMVKTAIHCTKLRTRKVQAD